MAEMLMGMKGTKVTAANSFPAHRRSRRGRRRGQGLKTVCCPNPRATSFKIGWTRREMPTWQTDLCHSLLQPSPITQTCPHWPISPSLRPKNRRHGGCKLSPLWNMGGLFDRHRALACETPLGVVEVGAEGRLPGPQSFLGDIS